MPRSNRSSAFPSTPRYLLRALALFPCAAGLGACSVSVPLAPLNASAGDDVTGSIRKDAPALSRRLDPEDWRRAKAAMGTALDPQGNGASVGWSNGQSGARGTFVSVAQAYPTDGRICRAFIAKVETAEGAEDVQGTACREGAGDWDLRDVKPWKG